MDPAHSQHVQNRFERIESALQEQDCRQGQFLEQLHQLNNNFQQLATQLTMRTTAPAPEPEDLSTPEPAQAIAISSDIKIGDLERYAGDPVECNSFITNCSIHFALQPHTFVSETAKVAFTINHLTGRARLWGTAEWERQTPACASFAAFSAELRQVFGEVAQGPDSTGGLLRLRQGDRTVSDYAIDFRTQARKSAWNSAALCDAFLLGLGDQIKDQLVSYDLPATLEDLIQLASRVDRRIQSRLQERRQQLQSVRSPPRRVHTRGVGHFQRSSSPDPEPMQLGSTRLTLEERERRFKNNLCMYCGQPGHFKSRCPSKELTRQ